MVMIGETGSIHFLQSHLQGMRLLPLDLGARLPIPPAPVQGSTHAAISSPPRKRDGLDSTEGRFGFGGLMTAASLLGNAAQFDSDHKITVNPETGAVVNPEAAVSAYIRRAPCPQLLAAYRAARQARQRRWVAARNGRSCRESSVLVELVRDRGAARFGFDLGAAIAGGEGGSQFPARGAHWRPAGGGVVKIGERGQAIIDSPRDSCRRSFRWWVGRSRGARLSVPTSALWSSTKKSLQTWLARAHISRMRVSPLPNRSSNSCMTLV